MNKIAWTKGALLGMPWCNAPRHAGHGILASYTLAIVGPEMPGGKYVQSTCTDCMEEIATDLGTTAEGGSV